MKKVGCVKGFVIVVALLCTVGFLSGCGGSGSGGSGSGPSSSSNSSSSSSSAQYHKITAEQAKALMSDGKPYTLVDVRTDAEFKAGHIAGAKLLPDTEVKDRAATELPDKSARILVYCRSGVRSAGAAHTLVSLGYTDVYDMGGIINWPYGTVTK